MRRLLLIVAALALLPVGGAVAQTGDADGGSFGGSDSAPGAGGGSSSGGGGSAATGNAGGSGYWYYGLDVDRGADPPCWYIVRYGPYNDPPPPERTYAAAAGRLGQYDDNGALYDACPGTVDPPFDPAAEAASFWSQRVRPPAPTAEVKPGHSITGLPSYLEIDGDPAPTWTLENPIGANIVIAATPRYEIDWGDGTPSTSTTSRGVAYPDRDAPGAVPITHLYRHARLHTITVSAYWTGSWRLASEGPDAARGLGELPIPTTYAFQLEVRQVQAVRDR